MKRNITGAALCALIALFVPTPSQAVQINANATVSSGFASAEGLPLSYGSLIYIGTFTIDNATIGANASNLDYLYGNFIHIGSGYIGQGDPTGEGEDSAANHGFFNISINSIDTTAYAGSQLYYWVFDSSSFGTATEHGVFSSTTWTIPGGDGGGLDLTTFTTDISDLNADSVAGTGLASTAQIVIGGFGVGWNPTMPTSQQFNLAPVPEPATYATLFGAGALGFTLWRRKRLP